MKLLSQKLKEQRGDIMDKLKLINATASKEERNLNDEENNQVTEYRSQIEALDAQIANAEWMEAEAKKEQEARNGKPNVPAIHTDAKPKSEAEEKRQLRREVSLREIIRCEVEGRTLQGREAEVVQAGRDEMLANKRSAAGIPLPSFMMKPGSPEQRAQSVGTSTQSGALVATEIGEVIEYLYPRTVLREMGATMWTGLSSNVDLIRQDGAATATWEGENDDNANTDPTVGSVQMRPKRLGAQTIIGKQLIFQTNSVDVENWIRMNLNTAQGVALETAAINGSGSAPIPRGILNTSGIGDVAIGTNGGAPTWDHILELESKVADLNAEYGNLAYLTTAIMRGKLKGTKKDEGSGEFVWSGNEMNGIRSFMSTLVPKGLTKGTSSDCHAIIYGNWNELYISQWDGLDLVIDPYTLAKKAQIAITVNGWFDVVLRHVESFAAIKDARNV